MKIRIIIFTSALAILGAVSSQAALTVVTSSPLGARTSNDVGYAIWDFFGNSSGVVFSGLAPTMELVPGGTGAGTTVGATDGQLFSATLGANMNGSRAGSGDRIYAGTGPNSNPFSVTLEGTTTGHIESMALQLKYSDPGFNSVVDYFTIVLTIGGVVQADPVQVYIGDNGVAPGRNRYSAYTYTWNELGIDSGTSFSFAITGPADHVSLDVITLDAHAVPEPSTWALLGLGGLALGHFARRRQKA